jgi:hypothetical protein
MKLKRATVFLLLMMTAPVAVSAKDIEVVLIGVTRGDSPAFEESFDKRLRENLSTMQDLSIADYPQSQLYRRKVHFDEFPVVSRKLIESLKLYCTDTTVFVWGAVKNCVLKGIRRYLLEGRVRGELAISLNVYSLRYKEYAFLGDIQTEAEKPKGFIVFGSAEEEIMISALDRKEITDRLLEQAALKCAGMIGSVIRSERLRAEKEGGSGGANKYEIPSVSDMFNMPSVEAASVNKNRGKSKPADNGAPRTETAPKVPDKVPSSAAPLKPSLPIDTVKAGSKPK